MKRGKRSVRSGMLIRLLAILYLPYLMFSMYRNYTSGEAGVSLALFIASEEGSFMTGETVVMDGGRNCGNLGE